MATPLVSVLMPVYNGEKYLNEAIKSIQRQTFNDFEFVIIDDGSIDNTPALLEACQLQDHRIKVYHQPNQGVVAALNTGLNHCQGRYIARMDADDISLPERLAKQVAFMETNPNIGACGTWIKTFGLRAKTVIKTPVDDAALRCYALFLTPMQHPTVMLRRKFMEDFNLRYDPNFERVEDYALWIRAFKHFSIANIPEVLLFYRLHPQQVGQKYSDEQMSRTARVWYKQTEELGVPASAQEIELHRIATTARFEGSKCLLQQVETWLYKLKQANLQRKIYPEPQLSRVLGYRWYLVCGNSKQGWGGWQKFWQSPLGREAKLSISQILTLGLKCAIGWQPKVIN